MSTTNRGATALAIAAGLFALPVGVWLVIQSWRQEVPEPQPIDPTAQRWAKSIAEQDAESIRNNDPDYKTPVFDDRPGHPTPVHPNTWHPGHPKAQRPR